MGRAPCCEKDGLKKGPWTPEEDQKLKDYIQRHGYGNWRTLPQNAGLQRCGKSCRLRWTNYLRPDIKRGRFSFEEEETIIQLHSILGNKWSAIAGRLPGRTDNEIKNYWNTHIRKKLLRMGIDPVTHSPRLALLDLPSILRSSLSNSEYMNISRLFGPDLLANSELIRVASSILSAQHENGNYPLQNSQQNQNLIPQMIQPNSFQYSFQEIQNRASSSEEQFPSSFNNFNSENCQVSDWQSNGFASCNFEEDYINGAHFSNYLSEQTIVTPSSKNSTLQSSNNNQNFSFLSALSTPSSSPQPLHSNSTYINSSTDDERESYCSDMLKYNISDVLEFNVLM